MGGIGSVFNFISKNRQALVNIFGVYFVFTYSIHNYRLKLAWDEREVEFQATERDFERVKATLGDNEWAKAVVSDIVDATATSSNNSKSSSNNNNNNNNNKKEELIVKGVEVLQSRLYDVTTPVRLSPEEQVLNRIRDAEKSNKNAEQELMAVLSGAAVKEGGVSGQGGSRLI